MSDDSNDESVIVSYAAMFFICLLGIASSLIVIVALMLALLM